MASIRFVFVVAVVALAATVCQGARASRQRTRYLARQEVDAAAVTPYPSADELKPEVPFEEAAAPLSPAGPTPDEVYGPPEQTYNVPDEVYGPPEVNENGLPAEDPAAEQFPAPLDDQQARLVAARRTNSRQRQLAYRQGAAARVARPAKLRTVQRRLA